MYLCVLVNLGSRLTHSATGQTGMGWHSAQYAVL